MKTLQNLNDKYPKKRAFITGAGSGLGAAFAQLLAHNNWSLHLADINLESLQNLSENLKEADVHLYQLDVSDKTAFQKISEQVKEKAGQIDLVINNAGIGDGNLFKAYSLEDWERMVQINLLGVLYGSHYLLPLMLDQKSGIMINIGSAAGFMNAPGMSAYNATKAAVYSLSETLYHELKSEGIHVSVVTPTFFKTNIMSQANGAKSFVDFATRQMKYSSTNAQEMAEVVLTNSANGVFQIVHPKEARRNRFLKKWFPNLIAKKFEKLLAKVSK